MSILHRQSHVSSQVVTHFPDSVIDAHVWIRFSQLAVGGLCGNVDIFDACVRKEQYQGTFEFTYVTKSQVRQGTRTEHINLLNVIAAMQPVITSLQTETINGSHFTGGLFVTDRSL